MAAYLEITLDIAADNRPKAADVYKLLVYNKYRLLDKTPGATSKELLVREEDVQVLHGFTTVENAKAYLESDLFTKEVSGELRLLLKAEPEVRIYEVA